MFVLIQGAGIDRNWELAVLFDALGINKIHIRDLNRLFEYLSVRHSSMIDSRLPGITNESSSDGCLSFA